MSLNHRGILVQKLSSHICSLDSFCGDCGKLPQKITPDQIKAVNVELETESDSDEELSMEEDNEESDDDQESGSDVNDTNDSSDEESEPEPGDIVWAQWYRKWHAARVMSFSEVPEHLQKQLRTKKTDYIIVSFYDSQKIIRIHKSKIEPLGENLVDKQRAIKDPASYSDALADQIYGN